MDYLLAAARDSNGVMRSFYSDRPNFVSIRTPNSIIPFDPNDQSWNPFRGAVVSPLYLWPGKILERYKSDNHIYLPGELNDWLEFGALRTSGGEKTPFFVLMPSTPNKKGVPEGRSGILVYEDDNIFTPLTVSINDLDYLVKLKGVGVPNGDNNPDYLMAREAFGKLNYSIFGSVNEREGINEFFSLEKQKTRNKSQRGLTPMAAMLLIYDNQRHHPRYNIGNQSLGINFSPTSLKLSYQQIPGIKDVDPYVILDELLIDYKELMELGLVHDSPHAENIMVFQTDSTPTYTFDDYADVQDINLHKFNSKMVHSMFASLFEIPGVFEDEALCFMSEVADFFGVRMPRNPSFEGTVNKLWMEYFSKL